MPRKTIPVTTMLDKVNYYLKNSPDSEQRERYATANLCETLLHDADMYAGFTYLASARVNYDAIARGENFDAADESRRFYHYHHKLM